MDTCYLCKQSAGPVKRQSGTTPDTHVYECPRCGIYVVGGTFERMLEVGHYEEELSRLRIATRRATPSKNFVVITTHNYQDIANSVFIPSLIQDRLNLILQILYEDSKPLGKAVPLVPLNDYPKFYCHTPEELRYFLKYLSSAQCIWEESNSYRLEVAGLDRVEKAIGGVGAGKRVFVAMSFDAEDVKLFDEVFEPVCKELGYEAYRVDRGHELGRIDDTIVANLRTSAFVIADFTKNKSGVYYEAGFGHALGRSVILTCPKSMFTETDPAKKLHFDINHYPFIDYETFEELKGKLKDRILARIGPYKQR